MQEQQKVAVLGAGAYGTALAKVLAGKGDPVSMYCRRPELVAQINEEGVNGKYLPTAKLPNRKLNSWRLYANRRIFRPKVPKRF